ncbi:MAG: nucleotidyltransferase family protein [Ilumatobacteraceae bacterium]|jgi:molybdenum cofactor cytidylyltransferase
MTSTVSPSSASCGALVLAAGGGSRYVGTTHKLLALLAGKPVVRHVLEAVAASGVSPIIVVTGAVALDDVLTSPLPGTPEVIVAHNAHWQSGMASSLQVGLDVARQRELGGVVVGLGDQPGVTANAWRRLADTNAPIAVATYHGVRRNPVRIHAELWDQLPHEGDEGARTLIRVRSDLVTEVACEGNADDIDTADDVARWQHDLANRGEY